MSNETIIFSMAGVSKFVPPGNKQILKNIYLSFFYGAKIGILGLNGSGKSTLLKTLLGDIPKTSGRIHIQGIELNDENYDLNTCVIFKNVRSFKNWNKALITYYN